MWGGPLSTENSMLKKLSAAQKQAGKACITFIFSNLGARRRAKKKSISVLINFCFSSFFFPLFSLPVLEKKNKKTLHIHPEKNTK